MLEEAGAEPHGRSADLGSFRRRGGPRQAKAARTANATAETAIPQPPVQDPEIFPPCHGHSLASEVRSPQLHLGAAMLGAGCRPGRRHGLTFFAKTSPAVRAARRSRCREKTLCFPIDLGGGTPTTKRLPYTRGQEFDASVSVHRSMTDEDQSGRSQGGRGWLLG